MPEADIEESALRVLPVVEDDVGELDDAVLGLGDRLRSEDDAGHLRSGGEVVRPGVSPSRDELPIGGDDNVSLRNGVVLRGLLAEELDGELDVPDERVDTVDHLREGVERRIVKDVAVGQHVASGVAGLVHVQDVDLKVGRFDSVGGGQIPQLVMELTLDFDVALKAVAVAGWTDLFGPDRRHREGVVPPPDVGEEAGRVEVELLELGRGDDGVQLEGAAVAAERACLALEEKSRTVLTFALVTVIVGLEIADVRLRQGMQAPPKVLNISPGWSPLPSLISLLPPCHLMGLGILSPCSHLLLLTLSPSLPPLISPVLGLLFWPRQL